MLNPNDRSRTSDARTDRLRALRRPSRPVVMVAGIAALASATGVGIASGSPSGSDTLGLAAASSAADGLGTASDAGTASAASGGSAASGADAARQHSLGDRIQAAAARGADRADLPGGALAARQAAEAAQIRQAAAEQRQATAAAEAEAARAAAAAQAAAQAAAAKTAADQAAAQAAAAEAAGAEAAQKAAADREAAQKAAASAVSEAGYVRPVPGTPHGSYGRSGSHWSHGHTGEDFTAASGTPVRAVAAGTVVKTGWGGAYGNEVVIKHADGKYTQYGHLSKFSTKAGAKVRAGQQIALSGSTGNSTGPHLHFEVRTGPNYGSDVNPIAYLRAKGVGI
ncbi:M23 family metallopeptidase [Yinghuangia sp. ASG 101]|uniref:M23 family metallopeptidase n=1 Tax=Yinghuangia sp. ASG 101 TaxID=2896848 RepID=UPI0022B21E59|nr:M23 family metallopeptidase [Yinghuangia sp. ASG 101]